MSPGQSRPVMIVGGPHDGKIVEYVGTEMREPVSRPLKPSEYLDDGPIDPMAGQWEERRYVLRQWSDTSGPTRGRRYVLQEQAKGLGADV